MNKIGHVLVSELVVHWCVYRNVESSCGCFLDIVVIVVDRLIFAIWCTARRKLWQHEVFLPDDEKKRIFEKECEATDALVRISEMLVDAAQILRHRIA